MPTLAEVEPLVRKRDLQAKQGQALSFEFQKVLTFQKLV